MRLSVYVPIANFAFSRGRPPLAIETLKGPPANICSTVVGPCTSQVLACLHCSDPCAAVGKRALASWARFS